MPRPKEFDQAQALDKAMQLFWEKGYEATSIQDLLAHMNISRGSLYATFGDKHSLFLAALDQYRANSWQRMQDTLQQTGPVLPAIQSLFEYVIEEALADTRLRGCLLTNSTIELAPHDPATAQRTDEHRHRLESLFQESLLRAQQQGEISPQADIRALAHFLFSSMQGLRVISKSKPNETALRDVVRITLSALN